MSSRRTQRKFRKEQRERRSDRAEKIPTGLGCGSRLIVAVADRKAFILKPKAPFREQHAGRSDKSRSSEEAMTEEVKTTAASETVISQKEVYMPKLVGHSEEEAEKILQGLDLHAG